MLKFLRLLYLSGLIGFIILVILSLNSIFNSIQEKLPSAWNGTAVFISPDGYLLTAGHVAENANRLIITYNKRAYQAYVVAFDPNNDLALLKVYSKFPFPSETIECSRNLNVANETLIMAGFPLAKGAWERDTLVFGQTIASSLYRDYVIFIPSEPGNSGSAVLESNGNIIGILVARFNLAPDYAIIVGHKEINRFLKSIGHGFLTERCVSGQDQNTIIKELLNSTVFIMGVNDEK